MDQPAREVVAPGPAAYEQQAIKLVGGHRQAGQRRLRSNLSRGRCQGYKMREAVAWDSIVGRVPVELRFMGLQARVIPRDRLPSSGCPQSSSHC
ncbi:hypothetical protein NDU88_003808 [Pleurodeles waltl]|uniref:Uncharacterized protein n=1 Tax=Pleurodeles waltl TaxID=8319 RepID=A0AAV7WQ30_PLEWA|nr:hypothetical protein NDU88_003808 [Pleurodeles waltl]